MFSRVRGTEDLLDLRLQNFVLDQARKFLQIYNYSQIQTPILEHTSLFVRSLGQETDVVTKEMYTFKTSEKGESICLRPEATAGTMRAFLENRIDQTPWKVWSFGSMFRHERPQKGRWRQFEQINVEAVGTKSVAQDAYFIKMLDTFFHESLKLENYVLKINYLGCKADREKHREKLATYLDLVSDKICKTCQVRKEKNILRVFDCKNETCQELYKGAPKLTECLCDDCGDEWIKLQELLELLSVNYIQDSYLVRGLDYYNKTVFEFTSRELGAQSAFCGGGRYELGKELGAKEESPSIGAAIGLGRLLLLVLKIQDKLSISHNPALHLILPIEKEQQSLALLLADKLHRKDICTEVLLEGASIKSMMRKANKMAASFVLILGADEQANGTVTLKNMMTGESEVIKQLDVAARLVR